MQSWLTEYVWLVPLYPLFGFFLNVLFNAFTNGATGGLRSLKRQVSAVLTIGATAAGLAHALVLVKQLLTGKLIPVEWNMPWITAGDFTLSLGYLVDPMSVMMLFVVTFISLFIQIYTHGYMDHDKGYTKFYAYLALFNFSMLGLVLSTNLFQMYIFWELVGVSSYLLIGFWFHKAAAAKACMKAFLMNRVGDFGLLIGILGLLAASFPWWAQYLAASPNHAMLSFSGLVAWAKSPLFIGGLPLVAIGLLLFMGPMAKSAQVPLHTWLPDAMEGPTPISALIHAATMVAAGIYLVGRIYPILQLSPVAMGVIAIIGTITAVVAASIALTQYDIKKALAYSTCSQLGFMMAAMGCGAFAAGLFHLFTHAFFKAMLFLGSGSVIHACEDEQDMRQMGGLLSKLPVTGITYLLGTLAISGVLWTSGFWSKDMVLAGAQSFHPIIFWTLAITAAFTSFYMFRTFFMTFLGKYRGSAHVHHENPVMTLPLVVLAVPSVAIGFLLSGSPWLKQLGWSIPSFESLILPPGVTALAHQAHGAHHAGFTHDQIAQLSIALGLAGLFLAVVMYWKPIIKPDWFIKLYPATYRLFTNKWYFDELYEGFVNNVYLVFARASAQFDRVVIDGIVNRVGDGVVLSSRGLGALHTGRAQGYVMTLVFGAITLSLLLIYWLL